MKTYVTMFRNNNFYKENPRAERVEVLVNAKEELFSTHPFKPISDWYDKQKVLGKCTYFLLSYSIPYYFTEVDLIVRGTFK